MTWSVPAMGRFRPETEVHSASRHDGSRLAAADPFPPPNVSCDRELTFNFAHRNRPLHP